MPDFAIVTAFSATDRLSSTFNKMGASADRFGNRAQSALGKANSGGLGMMSAFKGMLPMLTAGGLAVFANQAIDAWREEEAAIANVRAGLLSTKWAAGLTFTDLSEMADKLQKNSIFGDEDILQNATAQLLTFTAITSANFERVQSAAADVAVKLHGIKASGEDLHAVSIMMGKMMENPIKGLTAARRIGISFSAAEEQMVKSMVATNNTIGAQNYMLKIIEKQYGGTAKAMSMTEAGQALQRQHRIHQMMAEIGQKLSPMKKTSAMFIEAILPVIIEMMSALGNVFKAITPGVTLFGKGLGKIKDIVPWLVYGFLAWKAAVWGVTFAKMALMGIGWIQYLWMMKGIIWMAITRTALWTKAQWFLNAAMSANPIGLIIIGIAALLVLTYLIIKNWNSWGQAMTALMGPFGMLISFFKTLYDRWDDISKAFQDGRILDALKAIGLVIVDSILHPIDALFKLLEKKYPWIKSFNRGVDDLLGLEQPTSPNQTEIDSRGVDFNGRIDLYGAPPRSTFKSETRGAKRIDTSVIGGEQ